MGETHQFSLGAFAVIQDAGGHILLCHRRDMDLWNLPGGSVEAGELPTEAVIRETREETGLEIAVHRLTGVYGKAGANDLVFVFWCIATGGALTLCDEADDLRYFAPGQFPANTLEFHVKRIADAIGGHPQPVFRRQDRLRKESR
jgi:ADP-ribose pyrophosphatase YjhB (NUDIX family)